MSRIIPIINGNKGDIIIAEPNLPTLSPQNNPNLTPILNNENDLILQMNGVGPMGPPGKTGNGILKIEKTGSSDTVDTYTIFFTNGGQFEYQIVNGKIYYYDGPYEVIPMPYSTQILPTANLAMSTDVSVKEIPYFEVSNPSGGYTATIGDLI